MAAETLARRFHEAYERLAPQFGYATRPETRDFDPQSANGRLMVAVCHELLADSAPSIADAARVLAEFAKTAPGRLPQRVQDAIESALSQSTEQGERDAERPPTAEEDRFLTRAARDASTLIAPGKLVERAAMSPHGDGGNYTRAEGGEDGTTGVAIPDGGQQ